MRQRTVCLGCHVPRPGITNSGTSSLKSNVRACTLLLHPPTLHPPPVPCSFCPRSLCIQVAHQNIVTGLQLGPPALNGGPEATVGCSATITVEYITEDGKPLPWEVASSNIAVLLGLPNPDGQEGAAAAGSKRKSAGSGNANLVVLAPDREASQAAASAGTSTGSDAGGGSGGGAGVCKVCFTTPELTLAGTYTLTAEYTETRPEMVAALSQQVSKRHKVTYPWQKLCKAYALLRVVFFGWSALHRRPLQQLQAIGGLLLFAKCASVLWN